jgi:hypothetical protein
MDRLRNFIYDTKEILGDLRDTSKEVHGYHNIVRMILLFALRFVQNYRTKKGTPIIVTIPQWLVDITDEDGNHLPSEKYLGMKGVTLSDFDWDSGEVSVFLNDGEEVHLFFVEYKRL